MTYEPLAIAEAALAAAGYSGKLKLVRQLTEDARRTRILRCAVTGDPARLGPTVIIKQLAESERQSSKRLGLLRDWSALRLLSSIDPDQTLSPRFLAGNANEDLFVLGDLGDGESLVQALQGESPRKAEALLLDAATLLARLHGTTTGKDANYRALRLELGPDDPSFASVPDNWFNRIESAADALEVELAPLFFESGQSILTEIRAPGPLFSLVHGDPCPDNWLVTAAGIRLFDFEFSGFCYDGYALATLDAVFPRMYFPSCWRAGRLPSALVRDFESAYRTELTKHVPAASNDELFARAMSVACSAWLLSTLAMKLPGALENERAGGSSSLRPGVLSRLDAYLAACNVYGGIPALETVAGHLLDKLATLWPDAENLPAYPAFMTSMR